MEVEKLENMLMVFNKNLRELTSAIEHVDELLEPLGLPPVKAMSIEQRLKVVHLIIELGS